MKIRTFADWERKKNKGLKQFFPRKMKLCVGLGSCGIAAGAENVLNALKKEAAKQDLDILITKTGCLGFCGEEPLVNLQIPNLPLLVYHRVNEKDAVEIISKLTEDKI